MDKRRWAGSTLLFAGVLVVAGGLTAWKKNALAEAAEAAASQPEPAEAVESAVAAERRHRPTTTAIGTVVALRSVTLRNEVAGVVERVALEPGAIVDAGTVLLAFDTDVERAELQGQKAEAALARTQYQRMQHMLERRAVAEMDVDRTWAELDVALARIERTEAVIARKTLRAPFRARVGIADVHPGQYLEEGTTLTTLQGVDEGAYVDFDVAQHIATGLREGDVVSVVGGREGDSADADANATVVAIDARVDPATRNATVRARIADARVATPGASVRVAVPVGPERTVVTVPVSGLRKGPAGDHVFVLAKDATGAMRASVRVVEVGTTLGDEAVIDSGLAVGERIAASGSFKLREAALVAITDPQPASAGDAGGDEVGADSTVARDEAVAQNTDSADAAR